VSACNTVTSPEWSCVCFQADKENTNCTSPVSITSVLCTIRKESLWNSVFGSDHDVNYVWVWLLPCPWFTPGLAEVLGFDTACWGLILHARGIYCMLEIVMQNTSRQQAQHSTMYWMATNCAYACMPVTCCSECNSVLDMESSTAINPKQQLCQLSNQEQAHGSDGV